MKQNPTIVEVAMEIAYPAELLDKIYRKHGENAARACAMSNSVGGIGPLLKERIIAQADLAMNVVGICLLYDNVWVQGFHFWGQIYIEKKAVGNYLRETLTDSGILFKLKMPDGTEASVKVWKTDLGKGVVYYLDAPEISNVIYPGPEDSPKNHKNQGEWIEDQKLKQGWLVGRGTLALLKALNQVPDIIIHSETPTIFANHFLIMDDFQKDPFFKSVKYIFNDHTPLEYAHPIWGEYQIKNALIDPTYSQAELYWNKQTKTVDITRLLVGISDAVYGVSKKHAQVMRGMISLKGFENKIRSITNGVRLQDWQDPDYSMVLTKQEDYLLALKEKKKADLIEWVWKRYRLWYSWREKAKGKCMVLWTRRVTGYKRFDVLQRLLKDPSLKARFLKTQILVMLGGRIHQNDDLSQNVMFELIDLVTRDSELKDRILVLDNYNIWVAPKLFQGVDATIMLADDGREASATGFMKAQVNGAMVIASNDGAIPESVYFYETMGEAHRNMENGFDVPYVNGQPQPEGLMNAFEQLDTVYKDPKTRARMVRASFKVQDQVSVERCAKEMINLYATLI